LKHFDILFIHPPIVDDSKFKLRRGAYIFIPMGVFAIADYLEREGFGVKMINYPLEKFLNKNWSLNTYLKTIDFKICAIDLHWVHNIYGALKVAKEVKNENPNAKVILGGYSASFYNKELLKTFNSIDAIIRGDGEVPFLKYAKAIKNNSHNLENVPNLTYRTNQKHLKKNPITYTAQSLDHLNFTNTELLKNAKEYIEGSRKLMGIPYNLSVGRGCPFNCPLCGGGQRAQQKISKRENVLLRKPENVLEDIKIIMNKYDINSFFFCHGSYGSNLDYWEHLFKLIQKEQLDISADLEIWRLPFPRNMWECFAKTFNRKHSSISVSPRTTSRRVQKQIADICDPTFSFPLHQINQLIKNANLVQRELRIWLTLGYPLQKYGDIMRDFYFTIKSLLKYGPSTVKPITIMNEPYYIFPGSPAYEAPEAFGVTLTQNSLLEIVNSFKQSTISFFYNVINFDTETFPGLMIQNLNKLLFLCAAPMFLTS